MFHWRRTFAPADGLDSVVEAGFTGRSSARGIGPWSGLNLGGHVGDDAEQVEANRMLLARRIGVARDRLVFMNQAHGTSIVEVDGAWGGEVPSADAVITRAPDVALAVLVADCVPILLHDARAGLVAAIHAGRLGMTAGIVPRVLERLRELGARQLSAVVGPSVCGRCYEVPAPLVEAAAAAAASSRARSWTGTPAIDVAAGVVEQLASDRVPLEWVPGCTREDPDLYSYRRDGPTGRFAGVIVRRAGRPHDAVDR
ncbi:MAG: peptidoglycan editing factor PgeF [Intrasporangium sp.]|uniref:peptidoglycan editing factor PgeF n=1 Tax=Intrasporangium sp. TaxID=1925024 RepID=UPI002648B489|nr:peptidoglycan editing factor PgeF [Intrasporangium sp.]MDN5796067.1 peptidoglycan editing factor PgeF [Intrasporangium sp.]